MSENRLSKEDDDDPLVIDEDAAEKEFEPSVEMMVNDFDDERTLEEEEALETREEDEAEELNALNQEQDIPIEDLLKMYGYDPNSNSSTQGPNHLSGPARIDSTTEVSREGGGEEDDADGDDEEEEEPFLGSSPSTLVNKDKDSVAPCRTANLEEDENHSKKRPSNSSSPSPKKCKSELTRFYESTIEGRSLRSTTSNQGDEEDSDTGGAEGGQESDLEGRDFSWKKTIMIGPSFQASVPAGLSKYGDSLPYENDDKQLWDPKLLSPDEVENYLTKSYETVHNNGGNSVGSLPLGAHIRDDEQALFLLFQCGYNYEEALRRRRMNVVSPADTMSLWSEDECRAFELGLRLYGKDFTMIQQQKVRTRSVGEIVQFYYLWKKTERHDVFANANRLEKKKYTLHPGTTDYMDRFIDEQDSTRDRSSSPNYHSLLYGASNNTGESHGSVLTVMQSSNTNNKSSSSSSTSSNGNFQSTSTLQGP
ncbi:mesoderm induction early response protein 1 [Lepeophtheirus salmonis]|nr:mesoderm induction early response protein 1-like [Lepeophtheirus salmonis]